jgi:small Trp-rich protein
MWFVVIGLIALGLKRSGHTIVATLDWMWVLSPFPAAVVWWMVSDSLGLTQRDAMKKMERRREDRREKQLANLGFKDRRRGGDRRRRDKAFEGAVTRAPSTILPEQPPPKR